MVNYANLIALLDSIYAVFFIAIFAIGGFLLLQSFAQLQRASNVGFKPGYGISPMRILATFFVGIIFIYFPTTIATVESTMINEAACDAIEAYRNPQNACVRGGSSNIVYVAINMLFKTFGLFAIFKGFDSLRKIGYDQTTGKDEINVWSSLGFIVFGWLTYRWDKAVEWTGEIFPTVALISSALSKMTSTPGIVQ